MLSSVDKILRLLFSYVYRIFIVLYVGFIIWYEEQEFSILLQFLIISVIYVITIFSLKKGVKSYGNKLEISRVNPKAILRVALDYAFICYFLFGYDINEFQNYFIVLLPIINMVNHSENSRSSWVVYVFAACVIFVLSDFEFVAARYSPLIPIFIIIQFFKIRWLINQFKNKIFELIDSFYATNIKRSEITSIYSTIIDQITKLISSITRFNSYQIKPTRFVCFKIKEENLVLVNASDFIQSYEIPKDINIDLVDGESGQYALNQSIKLNEKPVKNNILIKVDGWRNNYLFVVELNTDPPTFFVEFLTAMIFFPTLTHLTRLFEVKLQLNVDKNIIYSKLAEKQEYVIKSMEVMHFVRGSLSPMKVLNEALYLADIEQSDEQRAKTIARIKKLRANAEREIENIEKRAKYIYEKGDNPFIISTIKKYHFSKFYFNIRREWESKVPNGSVTFDIGPLDDPENGPGLIDLEFSLEYDEDILHLVLTEIIENCTKYGSGGENLIFKMNLRFLVVEFVNKITPLSGSDQEKLLRLISKYNSNERETINQRESYGLYFIKQYIEGMEMESKLFFDNNEFRFQLTITKKND